MDDVFQLDPSIEQGFQVFSELGGCLGEKCLGLVWLGTVGFKRFSLPVFWESLVFECLRAFALDGLLFWMSV